jgi:hypothetical protein
MGMETQARFGLAVIAAAVVAGAMLRDRNGGGGGAEQRRNGKVKTTSALVQTQLDALRVELGRVMDSIPSELDGRIDDVERGQRSRKRSDRRDGALTFKVRSLRATCG